MTWHNKVIWTEGMFLQPQHFQQHDRFLARQAHLRFSITQPYGWGFMSLALDAASLTLGKIAIAGAHGVLPDGLVFDIPGQDAAPPALDVPADARDELVVLRRGAAAPRCRRDRCRVRDPARCRRASWRARSRSATPTRPASGRRRCRSAA